MPAVQNGGAGARPAVVPRVLGPSQRVHRAVEEEAAQDLTLLLTVLGWRDD